MSTLKEFDMDTSLTENLNSIQKFLTQLGPALQTLKLGLHCATRREHFYQCFAVSHCIDIRPCTNLHQLELRGLDHQAHMHILSTVKSATLTTLTFSTTFGWLPLALGGHPIDEWLDSFKPEQFVEWDEYLDRRKFRPVSQIRFLVDMSHFTRSDEETLEATFPSISSRGVLRFVKMEKQL
ncbi:hypothetical protein C8Q75DRAFT_810466 [Abortiporus biennis]|nr:hypothetical protein C8Q75DRAFT_810466 [Abortiporus biennis]